MGWRWLERFPHCPQGSQRESQCFVRPRGPGVPMLSVEYSTSQVLPKKIMWLGRRKGEGKAGEEKECQASEHVGPGEGQGLPCLQADRWAVQHKWTVLSLQAPSSQHHDSGMGLDAAEIHHGGPGTWHCVCHIGQGSSITRCLSKHCPRASWPCSAAERASPTCSFIAAAEGSKCPLGLPLLSAVLPKLLHSCRQVASSEEDKATDRVSVGHSPSAMVEQVQQSPQGIA